MLADTCNCKLYDLLIGDDYYVTGLTEVYEHYKLSTQDSDNTFVCFHILTLVAKTM